MMVHQVLEQAMKKTDSAQVAVSRSEVTPVAFQDDKLRSIKAEQSTDIELRVIVDGKEGFSSTTDPEGGQLYYRWDWGDGNKSNWLGPFDSGEIVYANNSWLENGSYEIRVKARDVHGLGSHWSDPLSVSMTKNRAIKRSLFMRLFERFQNSFPILKQLLNLQ